MNEKYPKSSQKSQPCALKTLKISLKSLIIPVLKTKYSFVKYIYYQKS